MPEDESRILAAPPSNDAEPSDPAHRQERGGTVLPEERRVLERTDTLVCKLSNLHRTGHSLIIGCAPNADVAIQPWPGISRFHLAFTLDDNGFPIARDLGSSGGTVVI